MFRRRFNTARSIEEGYPKDRNPPAAGDARGRMKNRRQTLRMTVMGIVRVSLPGDSRTIEAYLANISRGGVGIYLHRKVRVGQKLRFTVRLKSESDREEEVGAEVTWVSRAGDLYMVGVQFERLPKDQYQAVMNNLIP